MRTIDALGGLIARLLIAAVLVAFCAVPPAVAATPTAAQMPRCAPFEDSPQFVGAVTHYSIVDPAGPWVLWNCYALQPGVTPVRTRHCLEASWAVIDLRRLGDRVDTVRLAADPPAAWSASYKRHVTVPDSPRCVALFLAHP